MIDASADKHGLRSPPPERFAFASTQTDWRQMKSPKKSGHCPAFASLLMMTLKTSPWNNAEDGIDLIYSEMTTMKLGINAAH